MKQVKVTPARVKAVSADDFTADLDAEIRKGGTISYVIVKERLLDENGFEVSSYPHPDTHVPVPVLVDRTISTPFALRR